MAHYRNSGKLNALSVIALLVVMIAIGQTLSKMGALEAKETGELFNILLGFAYGILILRGGIWVYILKSVQLGFVSPLISLTYIIMLGVSHFYFGEIITVTRLFGCMLIAVGVFMVTVGEQMLLKSNHE